MAAAATEAVAAEVIQKARVCRTNGLREAFVDSDVETEAFKPGDPAVLQYLQEHGYAVVRGAAGPDEVQQAKELLWRELGRYGMERGQGAETWARVSPANPGNGIIWNDFGQSDMQWYLRALPGIRGGFASIWGTDELITSFDGANIFLPWGKNKRLRTQGSWWHVDQGAKKRGFQCVQGLVTLLDADGSTGGLCVIPGSHHHHEEILTRSGRPRNDFVPLRQGDPVLAMPARLVRAKAGDLVLWDSRTVHCNYPGDGPDRDPDDLVRAVGYICMMPRFRASRDVLEQRREMVRQRITTSHWPNDFRRLGAPLDYDLGDKDLSEMTPEQQALV
eukprot:TRINITY_DN39184_c0_g1_i1.p1 TRINITY_DN39184_c0_g1~~TRINITY_DN39184_c0_g1_i1.p1  ORF type:complete len:354 (+),score=84.01 TRINITY_DN39184_c0_g1_i1:65-1063(+)